MKTVCNRLLAFFVLLCFGSITAYAGCPKCPKPPKFMECEKTYIVGSQIEIVEDQIFVNVAENVVQTSALYADEAGLYFKDFRKQGCCPDGYWECSVCHDCTENYYIWCRTCYN